VTLRQQYRRRLHPLHVLLNILYRIYNLDDAIAFRFPPTVLADPVVCLKRALSLKNSYVDDFGILPTDSDSGQLDYVHTLSYHKLDTHNIIQLSYMYYSADKEDEQLTADHPEATPDARLSCYPFRTESRNMNFVSRKDAFARNMSFQKGLVKDARLIAQHSLQNWKEVVITRWAGELTISPTKRWCGGDR
jgi:hypothetical protein